MNSHVTRIFFGEATVTWQNMWERSNGKFSHNKNLAEEGRRVGCLVGEGRLRSRLATGDRLQQICDGQIIK
jgi:hypothetical protein